MKINSELIAKCQLLNITVMPYGASFYVVKREATPFDGVLCTPNDETDVLLWPTKLFASPNEAVEAAADPKKFGLAWDT